MNVAGRGDGSRQRACAKSREGGRRMDAAERLMRVDRLAPQRVARREAPARRSMGFKTVKRRRDVPAGELRIHRGGGGG